MAQELEPTGETEPTPANSPLGRAPKYPWTDWTNGKPWLIKQGPPEDGGDFTCSLSAMRSAIVMHQRRTDGLQVVISQESWSDMLMFQFYPQDQDRPKLPAMRKLKQEKAATDFCSYPGCGKALTDPLSLQQGVCTRFPTRDEVEQYGEVWDVNVHTGELRGNLS